MENQVEMLEDLLSRVKKNRLRMATARNMERVHSTAVSLPVESELPKTARSVANVPQAAEEDIIDLVHPTSIPPAIAADIDADDDDFSSVAPISAAPASPAAMDDDEIDETDLPPSMAPVAAFRKEDDFSSVAPVSTAPVSPAAMDDDEVDDAELPPSMAPISITHSSAFKGETTAKLELAPLTIAPVVEPQPVVPSAPDEDELEIANTDTASRYPVMPQETVETTARADAARQESIAGAFKPEIRSFQQTAKASGDVFVLKNAGPLPKTWTIDAVLTRAWNLGNK